MYKINLLNNEEFLTRGQKNKIKKVMYNIGEILNYKALQSWCKKTGCKVIIFGSRTRLQEKGSSDLDIMIMDYENKYESNNDYINNQRNFINDAYNSLKKCIINASIKLDFKLNLSQDEGYWGITYGSEDSDKGEVDFHFEWCDIPSFILISGDSINFELEESLVNIFDRDNFLKIG